VDSRRRDNSRQRISWGGWTLIEALLTVAIMGLVFAAAAPLLEKAGMAYSASDPRTQMVQEGRVALAHFARAFRQARAVTSPTSTGQEKSVLRFLAADGQATVFGLFEPAGALVVKYGPAAAPDLLASDCDSLLMTCYGAGGSSLSVPPSSPAAVRSVQVAMTVSDAGGRVDPMTLTTRSAIRRTPPSVVINEIMYKPPGELGPKDENQWVELYNPTAGAIDVGGWLLWTKGQNKVDTLSGDALYGTGSTVIPSGGYAVITDRDTKLYREKLENGDFESGDLSNWHEDDGWKKRSGDAVSGNYMAVYTDTGWSCLWQNFKIDKDAAGARLRIWERYDSAHGNAPRVVIRVTNRHSTVFVTVYDGPCHPEWTLHTADLSAYADVDARLEIWADRGIGDAHARIDAAAVFWNRNPNFPLDCLHLWVNDNEIGKDLEDGQVFIGSVQGELHDAVAFEKTWGGDDDGTTLSRVHPFSPSTEAETWKPGPFAGTPGAPN